MTELIRFLLIDKKTRALVDVVMSKSQSAALEIAQPLYPDLRLEAMYPMPPMAMENELTKRVRNMKKRKR